MKEDILSFPLWFRAKVYQKESGHGNWTIRNVVSYLITRHHGKPSRLP
jgi:hypothetical protein